MGSLVHWNKYQRTQKNLYKPQKLHQVVHLRVVTWTLGNETERTDRSHWIDSFRDGLVTEKATIAYNPWRIHGTGIFTYMNGWFLWYPHVKYIPLPIISISKTTLLRWHNSSTPSYANVFQASPPSLATSLTQCVWQLRSFWTKHRHTTVYPNVPDGWKQHLGQGKTGWWFQPIWKF